MSYTSHLARVKATSSWEGNFSNIEMRKLNAECMAIKAMSRGMERRKRILALLGEGYRILLNHSFGGSWNSKDRDLQYLLKKGKVKLAKQYEGSAINEHLSHSYLKLA